MDCTRVQFRTFSSGNRAKATDLPECFFGLPGYTGSMKALRLTLAALLCSVPLLAAAQWQWVDNAGRKVFSDAPPPSDVPANRILKQPGARATAAAAAGAPATAEASVPVATGAPPVGGAALKPTGKDKDLEARKKAAEAAEAEKRKAEESRIAAVRADNCERAKRAKMTFDSGMRVARTNAQGEREILDDKQREAESRRLDTIIARDCK